MNEVKTLNIEQISIKSNFEVIRKELNQVLLPYKGLIVTEETLKDCKADTTKLNKLSKAINSKKIDIKKEFTEDLVVFESECKKLIKEVDETRQCILESMEIFIEKQREQKRKKITEIIFDVSNKHELSDKSSEKLCIKDKYLNKSETFKAIKEDLEIIAKDLKAEEVKAAKNKQSLIDHINLVNEQFELALPLSLNDFPNYVKDIADIVEAIYEVNRIANSRKEAETISKQKSSEKSIAVQKQAYIYNEVAVSTTRKINPLLDETTEAKLEIIVLVKESRIDEFRQLLTDNCFELK